MDASVSEHWLGLTWSRPAGSFGIGATLYGVLRNQRGRAELLTQPVPSMELGDILTSVDDFGYWHTRLLAKMGLYWDREVLSVGITFTTPGLPVYGEGEAAYYRTRVSVDTVNAEVYHPDLVEEHGEIYGQKAVRGEIHGESNGRMRAEVVPG